MSADDRDPPAGYASPPCFMHELDPDYLGTGAMPDARAAADVARWRKAERERQIAARLAIPADERNTFSARIAEGLDAVIGSVAGRIVSTYWPFRGEPDLRPWMEQATDRGGRTALPLVVAKGRPLEFRSWRQGEKLARGVWNIPYPEAGETVFPDVVVAPVVAFDRHCFRLGYGGGFFDRTLAAMPGKRLVIGVGYCRQAIPTIYPQPHDIPMDVVVTEVGIRRPE